MRREEREKRWWEGGGAGVEEVEVPVEERLEERMERARFLRGGVSWGDGGVGGGDGTTGERRSGSWLRGFCATTTWWGIGGGGGRVWLMGCVNLQHCGLGVGWGSRWLFGCGGVCSFSLVEVFDLGRKVCRLRRGQLESALLSG